MMTAIKARLHGWLREPLVHFLLAGLAVFLWSAWRGNAVDPASRTITIDAPQVERLAQSWTQTWQRTPTPAELDGLIRDHIKEEIYYREALRLGLDRDDAVIRRRLMSKMEFLAAAQVENATPTEAELQQWLDTHRSRYAPDARYSFDQIYIAATDEVSARGRAQSLLAQARSGADWRALGDSLSVPRSLDDADMVAVAREFGDDFAAALAAQPQGQWGGPVASGFGLHLVRVRSATSGGPVTLSAVRRQVENDWRAATIERRQNAAYQALLDGYVIRIAKP